MRKILLILVAFFVLPVTANCAQTPQNLRLQLEKSWSDYQDAVKTKNGEKLKQTLSSYQYSMHRNNTVSLKLKFPDEYFENAKLDIIGPPLVPGPTIRRGDTASQVYYQIVKVGPASAPHMVGHGVFAVLFFVREKGRWKYDHWNGGYLDPNEAQRLKRKQKLPPLLQSAILPSGKVTSALKEIKEPDYVGDVYVETWGFKILISINGAKKVVMTDRDFSRFVAGLRKGKNIIQFSVASTGKTRKYPKEAAKIDIQARGTGETMWDNSLGASVFRFETKSLIGPTTREFSIKENNVPRSRY